MNLRLVNKGFKKLINRGGAWFDTAILTNSQINISSLVFHNFYSQLSKASSKKMFKNIILNMNTASGDTIIPLNDEVKELIVQKKKPIIDILLSKKFELPSLLCALITVAVIISGIVMVFFWKTPDFYDYYDHCRRQKKEICEAFLNKRLASMSFFSCPGAFGAGSLIKGIDSLVEYVIIQNKLSTSLENGKKTILMRSLLHRNAFLFLLTLPLTIYLLQNMTFLLSLNKQIIDNCINLQDDEDCIQNFKDQRNINNQYMAIIFSFLGYFIPIFIESIYNLIQTLRSEHGCKEIKSYTHRLMFWNSQTSPRNELNHEPIPLNDPELPLTGNESVEQIYLRSS